MFSRPKIDTDIKQIEDFLTRGVENVFPSKESFVKVLSSGKQLRIYLGIDPTGPTLHMGHAIPIRKLAKLQKMGHKVILLMGDFTAMIGDPTDKLSIRKQLSRKDVLKNLSQYKKQASKFLSFSGKNKAEIKHNSTWLDKMTFSDVINLASKMTVDQMLKRDMFRTRMDDGKPVFIHEFLYPLMQGYDSVAMNIDVEIGGNDQTFNMLTGRDLMRSMKDKEKGVIATKLLVDGEGKKMGKTEGNMISLADDAETIFAKVMSWSDNMIVPGFEIATDISLEEIEKEKKAMEQGANPRDSKQKLGLAIVELYHDKAEAEKAKKSFITAFSDGGIPANTSEVNVVSETALVDVLLEQKIVSSKTEFRRLIKEKAIKDIKTGPIENLDTKITSDIDVKVGKHRFIKIRLSKN